jgi:hypothetical protein
MAIVQRSQRLLIIAIDASIEDNLALAQAESCVAVVRGVPSELQARAVEEAWEFPRVYIETWEEVVPDPDPEQPA